MGFPRRDQLATLFVAVGLVAYLGWLAFADGNGTRVIAGAVLLLGVAASASAVVPGFGELLHGSKAYLVIASAVGLLAFVAGLVALIGADEVMLAVLVVSTIVLWAMATVRHSMADAAHRGGYVAPPSTPRPSSG